MSARYYHIILVLMALLLAGSLSSCRDDDENFQVVVIDSQEELERLILGESDRYVGNLILSGNITSLEILSDLEKIIGNLAIIDTQLTTLDGLENLILVTGDITITSTPPFQQGITDFCALQQLLEGGSFKSISITKNLFNPTVAEIVEGNCRL